MSLKQFTDYQRNEQLISPFLSLNHNAQRVNLVNSYFAKVEEKPEDILEAKKDIIYFLNHNIEFTKKLFSNNYDWTRPDLEKYKDYLNWTDVTKKFDNSGKFKYWPESLIERLLNYWDWNILSYSENNIIDERILEKYKYKWNWSSICTRDDLQWSEKLIRKYSEFICWSALSKNANVFWSDSLLNDFSDKIEWKEFYYNPNLPWSENFIEKYLHQLLVLVNEQRTFNLFGYCLVLHESIKWPITVLRKFKKYIFWGDLSLNTKISWNKNVLEEFKDELHWPYITINKSIHFTEDLIDNFVDFWDWEILIENKIFLDNIDLLSKYEHKWLDDFINWEYWGSYAKHKLFNNLLFIERYKDRLNWEHICKHYALNKEIISSFKSYIDWKSLSENNLYYINGYHKLMIKLDWEIELIYENRYNWDWDGLSSNNALNLNKELIYNFKDFWNWDKLCSRTDIDWDKDLFNEFNDYIAWEIIAQNKTIIADKELFELIPKKNLYNLLKNQLYSHVSFPNDKDRKERVRNIDRKRPAKTFTKSFEPFIFTLTISEIENNLSEWNWTSLSGLKNTLWSNEMICTSSN